MSDAVAPAFTLNDHAALSTWAAQAHGLRLRIMADHEDYEEVAEIFTTDPMEPLAFLYPALTTGAFAVIIEDAPEFTVPTLAAGLTAIAAALPDAA